MGSFLTRDTWDGNANLPMSFNRWIYGYGNPVNLTDPMGYFPVDWATPGGVGCGEATMAITRNLDDRDMKVLAVFMAGESSSGWVPDKVSYKKAWALLNKYSFDLIKHPDWTPYKSWKHHQRALTEGSFKIKAPEEFKNDEVRAMEYDQTELLKKYYWFKAGKSELMTAKRFSQIEMTSNRAVRDWMRYGPRSPQDPVNGATDFTDAEGLCFSDSGKGANCPGKGDSSRPFGKLGNTYLNVRRDWNTMEAWRYKFWRYDSTEVYQVGIDPSFENDPIYTFTRFKQPDGGWPQ